MVLSSIQVEYYIENGDVDAIRNALQHDEIPLSEINCFVDEVSYLTLAAELGQLEIVKLFVEYGADVNNTGQEDCADPALHMAVTSGNLELVKYLVDQGADTDYYTGGMTALEVAAELGFEDIYNYLLPLISSVFRKAKAQKLLRNKLSSLDIKECDRELIGASRKGNLSQVMSAIRAGANINTIDEAGSTPIHIAIQKENYDLLNILLKHGADPNINGGQLPAIGLASLMGRATMVKKIIKAGADLYPLFNGGPLIYWDYSYGNLCLNTIKEIFSILKENEVDFNIKDQYGNTALMYAYFANRGDLIEILNANGAIEGDLEKVRLFKAVEDSDYDRVQLIIPNISDINGKVGGDFTPLHRAAEKIIKILLKFY
ncbi:MAG: hypothetical protein HC921_17560 [Synechococcaceae cyanobacterium SM2_3_1]|nr:hypothetical protein [Synechococcaceae cyanobacterium SM2_3_1]